LSPNAPKDKPIVSNSKNEKETLVAATAPYIAQARSSYPQAKARFLKGLPPGQHFFATTIIHDSKGNEEQVFIAVSSIQNGFIRGVIFSSIEVVSGFKYKQPYSFPEADLIDWLITHADGSEEGNVVGKFLDTYNRRE
jgi:hypothetical protein